MRWECWLQGAREIGLLQGARGPFGGMVLCSSCSILSCFMALHEAPSAAQPPHSTTHFDTEKWHCYEKWLHTTQSGS